MERVIIFSDEKSKFFLVFPLTLSTLTEERSCLLSSFSQLSFRQGPFLAFLPSFLLLERDPVRDLPLVSKD
jgi:hypothetical protein